MSISDPQAAVAACFCEDTLDFLREPPYKQASRITFDGGQRIHCARQSGENAVIDRPIVLFSRALEGGDSLA